MYTRCADEFSNRVDTVGRPSEHRFGGSLAAAAAAVAAAWSSNRGWCALGPAVATCLGHDEPSRFSAAIAGVVVVAAARAFVIVLEEYLVL